MSVQTSVAAKPAAGTPGLIYDGGEFHDIQRYIASDDIPFGAVVKIAGDYVELPDDAAEAQGKIGVAVKSDEAASGAGGVGYKTGDIVPVMTVGRIWALSETSQADQAYPHIRHGGTGTKGALRNDADTANATQNGRISVFKASTGTAAVVVQLYPGDIGAANPTS